MTHPRDRAGSTRQAVLLSALLFLGSCLIAFCTESSKVHTPWQPTALQDNYKDDQKALSFNYTGDEEVKYHWVVTSCNLRAQWARTLSYTLLHGLLHDMAPTTINIAWCKHYDPASIPPELYNLRMSHGINVFFVPDNLTVLTALTTYITALSVPEYLGQPDLPMLITEDDVIFTLDFKAKLSDLVRQILGLSKGRPYIATLYSPSHKVGPVDRVVGLFKAASRVGKHSPRRCQVRGTCPRNVRAMRHYNAYAYASLGMLYSPVTAKYLRMHFIQAYYGDGGFQSDRKSPDVLINMFCRYRFRCSRSPNCELFGAIPSMVEHTGAYSAIQSIDNTRFHTTANFPFDVAFPNVTALHANTSAAGMAPPPLNRTVKAVRLYRLF